MQPTDSYVNTVSRKTNTGCSITWTIFVLEFANLCNMEFYLANNQNFPLQIQPACMKLNLLIMTALWLNNCTQINVIWFLIFNCL